MAFNIIDKLHFLAQYLRLCYDVSVCLSVHLCVCLSVMEVHWHIIANLSFKFRSKFTTQPTMGPHAHAGAHCELQCMRTHCGRGACREEGRGHLALC